MRACVIKRFGDPEVLEIATNVVVPAIRGDQLRIKVKSAGVNPVDTYIRSGCYYNKPELPYTPGIDGAGVVEACGQTAKSLKVGDRVYFCRSVTGSCAEYCVTSEEHTFKLLDNLSFQQGASLGIPYFTAYRALITKAKAKSGQSVLIHGASGGVGIACCQIAKHLGLKVLGTAGTAAGLKLVKSNGAAYAFNHRDKDYMNDIKSISKDGVDIIIEMLANVNLEKDLEIVSASGCIVIVGSRGKVEITPREIMVGEVTVTGVMLAKTVKSEWKEMGDFFHAGQQKGWIAPVVGREYRLEEVQQAHVDVIQHKDGSVGKIVLNID